jgi:signal recognition particle subunit SRP54
MDGDARGGAALSIRQVTGVPVKFIGIGEKPDAIEQFYPDRLAGRILGMGDILGLIDKAKETISEEDSERIAEKMKKGSFDLQDFVEQIRKVRNMGPLGQIMGMIPGFSRMKAQLDDVDDGMFDQAEAIVLSMTKWERRHPEKIDGKRRRPWQRHRPLAGQHAPQAVLRGPQDGQEPQQRPLPLHARHALTTSVTPLSRRERGRG